MVCYINLLSFNISDYLIFGKYGTLFITALVCCSVLAWIYFPNIKHKKVHFIGLSLSVLIVGYFGARFLHYTVELPLLLNKYPYYPDVDYSFFNFKYGGMTIIGGLIFGIIFIVLYSKIFKIKVMDVNIASIKNNKNIRDKILDNNTLSLLNTYSMVALLGISITRIGCYFNGCCFGDICPYNWLGISWSDYYKQSHVFIHYNHFNVSVSNLIYPTQFMESVFCFLLFIVLIFLLNKKNVFYIFIISYSFFRVFIEYFKGGSI